MTPPLTDRKDEELDRMLAILLGWTKIHLYEDNAGPSFWSGIPPASFKETFRKEKTYGSKIPDFCQSLDECARVEAGLTRDQCHAYHELLLTLVRDEAPLCSECEQGKPWALRWTWHASARQRTIALISTLQAKP